MAEKMESDILKASSDTENAEASDTDKRPKITKNLLEGKIPPSPSASEILCAASFLAFFERNCDICILECGESRADPTGIIDPPLVSVICGNSFTDEQLRTGTGIIRRGTREVVTSAPAGEPYSAILQSCVRIGSRLTVPAHAELNITSISLTSKSFEYRGKSYTVPTSCEYHLTNALVTIETVYALRRTGVAIRGDDVSRGIARAKIPLAFEIFSVTPTIILDCPKSESDVSAFIEALGKSKRFVGQKTILVTSPSFSFDITVELRNSGYDLTEWISPTNLSEIKSLAKKALHMNVDETMLILGDTAFVGTIKNQIQKVLALN
jgi:folylpolyglutamate synthase/dihydropteroate synthase